MTDLADRLNATDRILVKMIVKASAPIPNCAEAGRRVEELRALAEEARAALRDPASHRADGRSTAG